MLKTDKKHSLFYTKILYSTEYYLSTERADCKVCIHVSQNCPVVKIQGKLTIETVTWNRKFGYSQVLHVWLQYYCIFVKCAKCIVNKLM